MKNTPSPWETVKDTKGQTYALFGPGKHDIIAHLFDIMPSDVVAANARLIEAAPDLLESLKSMLTFASVIRQHRPAAEYTINRAENLIAKLEAQ